VIALVWDGVTKVELALLIVSVAVVIWLAITQEK
jgi:Flp pilus assembly pilin Flp